VFLSYWMRRSGLADVLPSLSSETVYLGVSAGILAATSTFAETYRDPRRGSGEALSIALSLSQNTYYEWIPREQDGKVRKQPCFIHPADEGARRREPRRGQSDVD
jgi:hypothetical protein